MNFEYDDNKSLPNKQKHGIDFEEAQELWHDPYAFEIPSKQNEEEKRVNIDFPAWMVQSLDKEAKHIGVSRQAIIKMWLGGCRTHA